MHRIGFVFLGNKLSRSQIEEALEVIALVPGDEIVLSEVSLPKLSPARLRQALPFALEEEVLGELDELHFASGPYQEGQPLPVAIVKHSLMKQWLNSLNEAGIKADKMIPLGLALPYQEKEWQVLIHGDRAEVRTGTYACFSTDLANLETFLDLKKSEATEPPDRINRIEVKQLEELEALLEESLLKNPGLNLLQQPYTELRDYEFKATNRKAWRIAGFTLAFWLALLFITPLLSFSLLWAQDYYLKRHSAALYHPYFPKAKNIREAALEMKALYQKEHLAEQHTLFLQWMTEVAKAADAVHLQKVNFQNNQLILDLKAASFSNLDAFTAALKAASFEVNQQSAAFVDNQVAAVIILKRV